VNQNEEGADEHSPAEAAWEDQDQEPGPEDEVLDEAWAALDAGDAKGALAKLQQLDEDWPERWIPEALARVELGELRRARVVLEQAEEFEDLGAQPDYLWAKAQLLLGEWRFAEARELLERLLASERSAAALERLSLVHEMEGDFATSEGLLDEAAALDPQFRHAPRLSPEEFEAEVEAAVQALPREFQKGLESCEVLIDAMPSGWMLEPGSSSARPTPRPAPTRTPSCRRASSSSSATSSAPRATAPRCARRSASRSTTRSGTCSASTRTAWRRWGWSEAGLTHA
jgi:tetratricopeptide (TPR) repeat protein